MLGIYRHFKGKLYKVISIGEHTETNEQFVVYQGVDDTKVWIRPLPMFFESVNYLGKQVPRFEFLTNQSVA